MAFLAGMRELIYESPNKYLLNRLKRGKRPAHSFASCPESEETILDVRSEPVSDYPTPKRVTKTGLGYRRRIPDSHPCQSDSVRVSFGSGTDLRQYRRNVRC